ncbi:MFS transporter [Serratia ficaria]|uniref:MFS transporter n=1 Tax=Serratia TaxID=613 RepID=UPI001013CC34|nr:MULTISPECIES: MFS transporter [Serratia]MEE4481423.1 MFS transporter [Serratia ficaria]CAI0855545.1 L-galactonate transporter [Serratia ficaria]CAI1165320.1 L-galactonate transporter [Serratia ficaria]CAI1967480.1 L-galactonate transporter [Serratia ficaria]CAI2037218.1 L-galactonate transporter [Serratia ficaria]
MFKNYRIVIALLLFFAGILNYLDRAALSVMAPLVKKDLSINDAQMGILFSCFFIGYCLFCFIGGWAADRFGPRRVYAWAASIWSLFCGATALVTGFTHLLIVRMLFGVGEGPMGTTTNKSIANWFPRNEVGRAVGFTNAGQPLGAAIAAPIVGLVGLQFGWRIAFMVIAVLGFIWVACWLLLFRDKPEQHPRVSAAESEYIMQRRPAGNTLNQPQQDSHSLWHYVFSLPVLGVASAFFCFNYIQFFFLSWLPSYLTDFQHLDIKSMSIIGVLPWLGATLGFLGGGVVSDMLFRRTQNFLLSRKLVIFVGLAVAALCVLLTAWSQSVMSAVTFITLASVFAYMTPQACWSLLQDIVPAGRIGTAGGFVHLLANLAGILSPSITGFLIQYGGGYHTAFILASILALSGMLLLALLVRQNGVNMLRSQTSH